MTNEVSIPALQPADTTVPVYERYCKRFKLEIKLYGLKQAMDRWRVVCDYMQTEEWWPAVACKVEEIIVSIIEEQESKQQAEREREKDSKSSLVIINKTTGIEQVDQLNGVVEKDAEVTHTKKN